MEVLVEILILTALTFVLACTHDGWIFYQDSRGQRVDRSKLIADTVLLCGTHIICNQSAIPFPVVPQKEQHISTCVECRCDVDCWSRGDCCVDLPYLYLTSSCQSTQEILKGSNAHIWSKFNFEMIASCPEIGPGVKMKDKCDGYIKEGSFLDYDQQAPVTSVITHVTYRNKYCARCHGDLDVIRWDRLAKCLTPIDTNTVSTMNEFKNALYKHNCSLVHEFPSSLPHIPTKPCLKNERNDLISTCNETGLWMNYDPSIKWACENFRPNIHFLENFRNIFCYICNPSIATVHHDMIIDHCNLTGEWQLYDKSLEDGCLNLPSIQRLRPFKNSYCMLCNGREPFNNTLEGHQGNLGFVISSLQGGSIALIEFLETSLSNLLGNREKDWETRIFDFDIDVEAATSYFKDGEHDKNIFMKNSSFSVNYNVLKEIQLICGENSICLGNDQDRYSNYTNMLHAGSNSLFSTSACGICDCSENCLYDKICCVDLLLKENPYECISNGIFHSTRDNDWSPEDEILAISTCKKNSQPAFIRDNCHQHPFSNLIRLLPGRSNQSVIFKNIFCSYCHDFKDIFKPLDIKITCPIQLEPTMFLSFSSLVRTALERKCDVRAVANSHESCKAETWMVSKCNTTVEWNDYNERVKNMCEMEEQFSSWGLRPMVYREKMYKNIFCFMCNSEITTQLIIRHCNVTGNWNAYDPAIEQACEQAPEHIVWYPYKNWFCSRCNEDMDMVIASTEQEIPDIRGDVYLRSRRLISLKLPSSADLRKEEGTCTDGMYDSYKMACSKVYCPVGRELKNSSSLVFLEETKNLRYSLTFQLVCISDQMTYGGLELLLQNISSTVMAQLWRLENNLKIKYGNIWTNEFCEAGQMDGNMSIMNKSLSISFHAILRIPHTINRTALELALLGFRNTTFQLENDGMNRTFKTMQSSARVPDYRDNTSHCMHIYIVILNQGVRFIRIEAFASNLEEKEDTFKYRPVNDLLVCVMVEVSKNEYIYNNETKTVMLLNTNTRIILERDDFEFQTDGSIRVCREHLNRKILTDPINTFPASTYQASLMVSIHGTFSYVCTMISIICLVITFVTYSLFKTLRSLPGKNNMCLVSCLLCAQILLQFGFLQSQHHVLCQVLAIGIHFFWMATFSSMNVCSFHMYKVFCSDTLVAVTGGDSKKVLRRHIAYIFALPFLVILTTIIVNSALSDGKNTGYGGGRCFLNNQYSIIFAFIIPSAAIFISNAFFFAIAFHKIRTSPSIRSNSEDKRNFFMYVKLSTITGIAWPLQIIDGLLELSVFSFFVTFVNALQGMFIFASYICNRRVWTLYIENCCRRIKPKESQTNVVCDGTASRTEQTHL